jgi:four helix bundle protein
MRNYKALSAWQRADELTFIIYQVTKLFPVEEIYGITSQIRRSAYSVPANIAEGCGRESNIEYLRFLSIARGSLAETEYFLHLANRLEYLSESDNTQLTAMVNQTFATLGGLIKSVKMSIPKKDNTHRPIDP